MAAHPWRRRPPVIDWSGRPMESGTEEKSLEQLPVILYPDQCHEINKKPVISEITNNRGRYEDSVTSQVTKEISYVSMVTPHISMVTPHVSMEISHNASNNASSEPAHSQYHDDESTSALLDESSHITTCDHHGNTHKSFNSSGFSSLMPHGRHRLKTTSCLDNITNKTVSFLHDITSSISSHFHDVTRPASSCFHDVTVSSRRHDVASTVPSSSHHRCASPRLPLLSKPWLPNLLQILVLSVLCVSLSEAALHSAVEEPAAPKPSNCTGGVCGTPPARSKVEVNVKLLPTEDKPRQKDNGMQRYSHDNKTSSEPDVTVVEQDDRHHWKTKIIIGCTIAAAVEICIVIFIVVYWREIRWTMRKISCPCDERAGRRRDHEAMERSVHDTSATDVHDDDEVNVQVHGFQEVQIYAIPSMEQEEQSTQRPPEEQCFEVTEV